MGLKFYHIAAIKNRKSILRKGLIPCAGERSKRFGQHENRIYLIKDREGVERLLKCLFWNTHPDFKEGFDIYEVAIGRKTQCFKDEKYSMGYYITTNIKSPKLIQTI